MSVPFFRPSITQAEIDEVVACLKSGWLTTGPRTKEFEATFARRVGAKHAIALNSCTAALHLALEAIGLKRGEHVLVPTMTFAATAEVVRYFDANPVLVDCDPRSLCIEPEALLEAGKKLGGTLRAIIPMHYGGQMVDVDAVQSVAKQLSVPVIEDAAHTLPAYFKGRQVGSTADITCFSFYANKCITTGGEGGMAVTDNDVWADRMRVMSLHGMSKDAWKRFTDKGSWYYELVAPGFKYNLTDIAAGIGLRQLDRLDALWAERRALAARYTQQLSAIPGLELPEELPGRQHSWHLYAIRLAKNAWSIDRARFIDELKAKGITTSVHWMPLHLHPYYRQAYGTHEGMFPVAEDVWPRLVSLPIFPGMTHAEQDEVVTAITELARHHGRWLAALALAAARLDPAQLPLDDVRRNVEANSTFQAFSLGVVTDDGLIMSAGVPAERVFRIGSVTKTFTGLLLLILRDEGKLSLEDPLTQWLPEAKGLVAPTSDSPPITLRNLVTHTSGIPRVGPLDYSDGHEITEAQLLGALKGLKLEFAPGSRVSYSNLAMGLAGIVIKRVAKRPYREVLKEKVLAPLGIKGAWAKADVPPDLLAPSPGKVEWKLGPIEAAGGLYLSLDELAKWVQLQLSAWPPRDGPESKVARRSTLRESQLRAGFSGGGGEGFGVNWGVSNDDALGYVVAHTGSTSDYHSSVIMLPQRGLAVISLASGSDADHLRGFTREQLTLLFNALPKPVLRVGAAARAGLEHVKALWANCDEAAMRAALTPAMFEVIWPKGQCGFFEGLRAAGVPVSDEEVLESDEGAHARLRLKTEKGQQFEVTIATDPQPPNRVAGLLVKPMKPAKRVPSEARAALDKVKGLWARCDETAVKAAMAPSFTAAIPWQSTCKMFDGLRANDGLPKSEEALDSDGPAKVRLRTDRDHAFDVTVSTQTNAPYLMTGLTVKPAPN